MTVYFTSDLHFGHANIIGFCNRPFDNIEQMNLELVRRFNNTVKEGDTTYFLGDLGRMTHERFKHTINSMNGNKIMILGNHDKGTQSFLAIGFDAVMLSATLMIDGKIVTLSHYPLLGVRREDTTVYKDRAHENWHGETKAKKLAVEDRGQFHLHGHLHCPCSTAKSNITDGRQRDIGVDGNNFMPVSVRLIEKWIRNE